MRTSIFDQLGGGGAIGAAVDDLYDRLLADPVVAPYFQGVVMGELSKHLRMFLAAALGGPDLYRGRDMRSAHARLRITHEAWDRTVGHLLAVLSDLRVEQPLIDQVVAHLAPLHDDIVTASEAAMPVAA